MSDTTRRDPYLDEDGDPDASAIAASYWPPDGPHTHGSVAQAALGVDELTHYLARATAPWENGQAVLPRSGDLYRVIGELRSGLGRLDQVFDQLAVRADNIAVDDTLHDDRLDGRNPGDTAAGAAAALRDARRALPGLIDALARAHNASGHLGHHTEPDQP